MAEASRRWSNRSDSIPPPPSSRRSGSKERVLVIDDSTGSRQRTVSLLCDAGYLPFEQPSAIGVTRTLLTQAIPAVIVDLGMPGLSAEKLITMLRSNPRLEGLVIVVITNVEDSHHRSPQSPIDADAVVLREHLDTRLVPTLQRLLCTSGFHPLASNLGAPGAGAPDDC